ncbi:SBBP repeat-containing protein [Salmonirosea aquatica]|uniref:Bulb-type lectin domain-containing protein n=1 Tax=Salmonirosea aquatica TaxID=2654236 RepID=A0A7C9BAL5_9BACT|nr:hypothetical protein [Cytophagaceae bacterium SJW1-29]
MKRIYIFLFVFILSCYCIQKTAHAQIKIGGSGAPNPSAVLELESSNQGFLLPRLTSSQRDSIAGPVDGMLIFNVTLSCTQLYSDGGWACLGVGSQSTNFPLRLTFDEIAALPSPVEGDLAYDKTFHCLRYYNGIEWLCTYKKTGDTSPEVTAWKTNASYYGSNAHRIAVSPDGSVYINSGPGNRVSDGNLAKYDKNGNLLWVRVINGAVKDIQGSDLDVDSDGNVYMVGSFDNSANFGSTSLTSYGGLDIFIVKYNSNGDLQWLQQAGGTQNDFGFRIAVDASRNIYISGVADGTAGFGSLTLNPSSGGYFIAKYNSSGVAQWVQRAGGAISGIAVQGSGALYITGSFGGTVNFGSIPLTALGGSEVFIAKYTSEGAVLWAKSAGGGQNDTSTSIAVDSGGNTFVTGDFSGTATFGSTTLTSNGITDMFVAKYDINGISLWAKSEGGSSGDSGSSIAVDSDGNAYVTGTGYFTEGTLLLTKYNGNGTVQWSEIAGGTGTKVGSDVALSGGSDVFITGFFTVNAVFGATKLTTYQQHEVFVARYKQ